MVNRLFEAGLPWDPEEIDVSGSLHAPLLRPKTLAWRDHVVWIDEGDSWHANMGQWCARVARSEEEPPAWEWRAFSMGLRPRSVGGRFWSTREAAQRDAEKTLAELD